MRLAKRYWVWRLYHFIVADAVSVQRPTKYKVVRDFLGEALGIAADMGCGPGVFAKHHSPGLPDVNRLKGRLPGISSRVESGCESTFDFAGVDGGAGDP